MPNQVLLEKYAKLIVETGVNVQPDQRLVIRGTTEAKELIREITKAAYNVGSKQVHVLWSDDYVAHDTAQNVALDVLKNIPEYLIAQYQYFVDEEACFVSLTSPIPGLNADLDAKKQQQVEIATQQKLSFFRAHTMGNKVPWVVAAAPNLIWAEAVFPKLKGSEALEALWSAVFAACRVNLSSNPTLNWKEHNKNLTAHNQVLNNYNFKSLHFKNSIGTDVTIELVENHIWAGGIETAQTGVKFNPNLPTEETFTMPHKFGTNGKIVSSKPLNYQGKLINDFWLEFKDGKVIDFDAKEEKAALESLLNFDEGARYLGEVALISHNTPISETNIVFLNTLFDENASCHVALGRAYPMNIKDGNDTPMEELLKKGYNNSMTHVDFMFGSSDMEIIGTTQDGKKIQVFKAGNFVI